MSTSVTVVDAEKTSLAQTALSSLNVGAGAFSDLAIARFIARARENLKTLEARRTRLKTAYAKFVADRQETLETEGQHGEPATFLSSMLNVEGGMQYTAEFRVGVNVTTGDVSRFIRLKGDSRDGWEIDIPFGPVRKDEVLADAYREHQKDMEQVETEILGFKRLLSPESLADLKLQVNASVTRNALEQTVDGAALLSITDSYVDGLVPAISPGK